MALYHTRLNEIMIKIFTVFVKFFNVFVVYVYDYKIAFEKKVLKKEEISAQVIGTKH